MPDALMCSEVFHAYCIFPLDRMASSVRHVERGAAKFFRWCSREVNLGECSLELRIYRKQDQETLWALVWLKSH